MPDAARFVQEIERIAAQRPVYRVGGMAKDGTCDCVGLIMAAMDALCGRAYDMHCTNYFARFETIALAPVSPDAVFPGQILYKVRAQSAKLNARYLPGGRYDTGDDRDYYHVGVVTSVSPLRIVECTLDGAANGIRVSDTPACWDMGGRLKGVDYGEKAQPWKARVCTQRGALNLRSAPDGKRIGSLARGEEGTVLACEDGWAYVDFGGRRGYASLDYLSRADDAPQDATAQQETALRRTSLIREDGMVITLEGGWRIAED